MSKEIWIALSLPLIGVAIYLATQENKQTQVDASALSSTTNERISTAKSSPTNAGNKNAIPFHLQVDQANAMKAKVDAEMREVALSETAASQRQKADYEMKIREPQYRKLFESWNLDRGLAEKTLSVIRDREEKITALRLQIFKNGVDSAVAYQKKIDSERGFIDLELINLLGSDRFQQFAKIDSQLNTRGRESGILRD